MPGQAGRKVPERPGFPTGTGLSVTLVSPWFSVSSVLKFYFAASPALTGRGVRMRYHTGVVRACSLFLKTLTRRTRRTTEMHGDVCASSDACLIREWPFCLTGYALRLEAISGCERTKPSVSKRTRFRTGFRPVWRYLHGGL